MKLICRCQDVTEEEVIAAIRQGATTVDEIRRLVRAGMGTCQGRTCRRLVAQILARELQRPMADIYPPTFRPPNRPVPFKLIMAEVHRQNKEGDHTTVGGCKETKTKVAEQVATGPRETDGRKPSGRRGSRA